MAKLTRYVQKLFGSTAGANRISEFGSLAAGTPTTFSGSTVTPDDVQALSNYLQGWDGAVIGNNSPAIQDMNAVQWLLSRQLAYLFQAGIPEYDASTAYYQNSFCQVSGTVYLSLTDNNVGNTPASSPSNWSAYISPRSPATRQRFTATGTTAGHLFTISTSSTCAAGDTYTNNGHTYTVLAALSAQSGQVLFTSGALAPTASGTLTRSSGAGTSSITFTLATALATYTTPANCTSVQVECVGGGGGGQGSVGVGGEGGNGTASFFGALLLSAGAGVGGGAGFAGGAGGTGSLGGLVGIIATGNSGGSTTSVSSYSAPGGNGGGSFLGGGAAGGAGTGGGANAQANTGGGGGGTGADSGAPSPPGAGGGGGGYVKGLIYSPAATYVYAVGAGGSSGAGIGVKVGGTGGSGEIVVTEYYQ
jgi:hypothetical protein